MTGARTHDSKAFALSLYHPRLARPEKATAAVSSALGSFEKARRTRARVIEVLKVREQVKCRRLTD